MNEGDAMPTIPSHVLEFVRQRLGYQNDVSISIQTAKSAQQRVWILTLPPVESNSGSTCGDDWKDALEHGSHRLVVRLWMSARCWWNLNHLHDEANASLDRAARSEITGYRLARQALTNESSIGVWIPRVLHFSGDNTCCSSCDEVGTKETYVHPWAILEYVGEYSELFDGTILPDTSLVDEMVKIRHEFGFDEPHPRWGRLSVEDSLPYALHVLQEVVIPLHIYCEKKSATSQFEGLLQSPQTNGSSPGFRYMDMLLIYRQKYNIMQSSLRTASPITAAAADGKLQQVFEILGKAIDRLEKEAVANGLEQTPCTDSCTPRLRCVLCHMDLQPQNLLFGQTRRPDYHHRTMIRSVLDWEEAAYADPRFELLLLCRKVVANRAQANDVWQSYEQATHRELGPIEPWLKLETVHSLTTLLLQACAGGGRSAWESMPDLWGKVERELQRLVLMGWTFCQLPRDG